MDNPFLKYLQQQAQNTPQQSGGQPPMPPQGGGMGAMMAGLMGGKQPQLPPDVTQPGQTGDNTKPLLQAVSALHAYISQEQDTQSEGQGYSWN